MNNYIYIYKRSRNTIQTNDITPILVQAIHIQFVSSKKRGGEVRKGIKFILHQFTAFHKHTHSCNMGFYYIFIFHIGKDFFVHIEYTIAHYIQCIRNSYLFLCIL